MIFGKGKIHNLVYNNLKVEQVNNYTYLGVNVHKSGDIKTNTYKPGIIRLFQAKIWKPYTKLKTL